MQSSSIASPKRSRSSPDVPGTLLSMLLVLVVSPSHIATQCPASSQCIHPQPMPAPLALGETELDKAVIALRCELACTMEVSLHACMQQYLWAMGLLFFLVIPNELWLRIVESCVLLARMRDARARTFKACLVVWGFNQISKHKLYIRSLRIEACRIVI